MGLRNSDGRDVDPVPFLVIAISAALVCLSFGPFYLRSWGFALDAAIAWSGVLAVVGVIGAYYRYVWAFRPETFTEVPVASRFLRLGYAMVIFALVLFGLTLPIWL